MSGDAALFDRIAVGRAGLRCECRGKCGRSHQFGAIDRCGNAHGRPSVQGSDKFVSLLVVPINGDARDMSYDKVAALCGACLKNLRTKLRAADEKAAARAAAASASDGLFGL
ncbi:HNH endonuclease [Mycobacterium phage Nibb]|uniref:HNH endonuclease n=1 Tax=Mycobacterium phage Nibb TaxID=2510585 RepID=A0A411B5I7_9CAUD|nr:HNH endonuclease [Mycobacterium phage Nibb]QAX95609.1 HNH endonuclease [Mycobacterium phage Nibb]